MDRKLASMLSLCQKAGKLISGGSACEDAIRSREAKLAIACEDASENTRKRLCDKASFYNVPCYVSLTKEDLSRATGKDNRAAVVVTDVNFAKKIEGLLQHSGE